MKYEVRDLMNTLDVSWILEVFLHVKRGSQVGKKLSPFEKFGQHVQPLPARLDFVILKSSMACPKWVFSVENFEWRSDWLRMQIMQMWSSAIAKTR